MSKSETAKVRLSPPPPPLMVLVDPLLIFTERPWRFNFAGGAPVMVTHRDRVRRGRPVARGHPAGAGSPFRAALDDRASPFELGLKVPRGYVPFEAEPAEIARSLIRVDNDGQGEFPCVSTE
ncbi:grhN [Rhodococcus sp. T7]|uniref:grhN n=1 Tax=Rhodococcus sp. T7 TaxID=627444 RepID=UPI00135B85EB|nr:grhN [Rhodococcus sp. T7]KAF0966475.1 hypothetical protein MLGJGCBP_00276 [Rhodococcus sp. T7]